MTTDVLGFNVSKPLAINGFQFRPEDTADDQGVVDVAVRTQLKGWIDLADRSAVEINDVVTGHQRGLREQLQPPGDGEVTRLISAAVDLSGIDVTEHHAVDSVQLMEQTIGLHV